MFTLKPKDLLHIGIGPFFVFMLNYSLCYISPAWYDAWSIDTPLHFLGGLSVAYSSSYAIHLLKKSDRLIIKNRWLTAILIISTVALAAVLWEFYEFISDRYFGTYSQPNVFDVIKDLFMGLLGALTFCSITRRAKTKALTCR